MRKSIFEMTAEELHAHVLTIDDDSLIAWATTCSDAGMRLTAEIALRDKHPSNFKLKGAPDAE